MFVVEGVSGDEIASNDIKKNRQSNSNHKPGIYSYEHRKYVEKTLEISISRKNTVGSSFCVMPSVMLQACVLPFECPITARLSASEYLFFNPMFLPFMSF